MTSQNPPPFQGGPAGHVPEGRQGGVSKFRAMLSGRSAGPSNGAIAPRVIHTGRRSGDLTRPSDNLLLGSLSPAERIRPSVTGPEQLGRPTGRGQFAPSHSSRPAQPGSNVHLGLKPPPPPPPRRLSPEARSSSAGPASSGPATTYPANAQPTAPVTPQGGQNGRKAHPPVVARNAKPDMADVNADRVRLNLPPAQPPRSNVKPAPAPPQAFSDPHVQPARPVRSATDRMTTDSQSGGRPKIPPVIKRSSQGLQARTDPAPLLDSTADAVRDGFPDTKQANRRKPIVDEEYSYTIKSKSIDSLVAVCDGIVVSTGSMTCVWELKTGATHLEEETSRVDGSIAAVCFKSLSYTQGMPMHIWYGSSQGVLTECTNWGVVVEKSAVHHRGAEVVAIHRVGNCMWTIDDAGRVNVWPPSPADQMPSLKSTPFKFSAPKLHTFSLPIGNEVWYAANRKIYVFSFDPATQQLTQKTPDGLTVSRAGDITAGCVIPGDLTKVYFSHSDGRISVFDRASKQLLRLNVVTRHRITGLVGVGNYLWVSLVVKQIRVYDPRPSRWKMLKEWAAHQGHIKGLLVDRAGCWNRSKLVVVSYGPDQISGWDGYLQADWVGQTLIKERSTFSKPTELEVAIFTWNAGEAKPTHSELIEMPVLNNLIDGHNAPHIIVFGFQEVVPLDSVRVVANEVFKIRASEGHYKNWSKHLPKRVNKIASRLPQPRTYKVTKTDYMVGLFSLVLTRIDIPASISNVKLVPLKLGLNGIYGNKGGLLTRMTINSTSVCFINCHLPADTGSKQEGKWARDEGVARLFGSSVMATGQSELAMLKDSSYFAGGGTGEHPLDYEVCFMFGDMNYRLDSMTREGVIQAIEHKRLDRLRPLDQLLSTVRRDPDFLLGSFNEMDITFDPTYKYDVGTDTYDTSESRRPPAWCDRILSRSYPASLVKQHDYRRHVLRASDHRPVTGRFTMTVDNVDRSKRNRREAAAKQEFAATVVPILLALEWKDYCMNFQAYSASRADAEVTAKLQQLEEDRQLASERRQQGHESGHGWSDLISSTASFIRPRPAPDGRNRTASEYPRRQNGGNRPTRP